MASSEYERGFRAGLEFGRLHALTVYDALDAAALEFKRYLSGVFEELIDEAAADPEGVRRRLLRAWHERPLPTAEVIDLAAVRETLQGAA